jgi:hypothetical protein
MNNLNINVFHHFQKEEQNNNLNYVDIIDRSRGINEKLMKEREHWKIKYMELQTKYLELHRKYNEDILGKEFVDLS